MWLRYSALMLAMVPAVAAAQPANAQSVTRIDVELSSFKIMPETITLDHGKSYVLHIANTSTSGHNFVAKGFFAASRGVKPPLSSDGKIELGGGESVDIKLIAPAPGRYDVHCSHLMHSTFGMKGTIIVR